MQIIVNISDKVIDSAINDRVEWSVMDEYREEVRKAAGVTQESAAKLLREDTKFMANLNKQLGQGFKDLVDDIIYDCVNAAVSPALKKLHTQLTKAERAAEKEAAANMKAALAAAEAERLINAIKELEKQGYKITKA